MTEVLIELATTDRAAYEVPVPDEVVKAAIALFRTGASVRPGPVVVARQVSDSLDSGGDAATVSRGLRFEADGLEFDVLLRPPADASSVLVSGRVVDRFSEAPAQAEVIARVAVNGRAIAWTHTDAAGEFRLSCERPAALQVQFLVPGPRPMIDVMIDLAVREN